MADRPVVANLDFQDIKDDMIQYFRGRPEFADYEFTGSSLNLLMDILAYNTHYNSLAANFLVNEMFLDSAVMRDNVVSIAKALNYQPRSAKAATATLTLSVPKTDSDTQIIIIPTGSVFTATSGNTTFNFYTTQDYTVQFETNLAAGALKTIQVEISEGTYVTQRFVAVGEDFERMNLSNADVDIETLTVSVNGSRHTRITPESQGITEVNKDSLVFFTEETRNRNQRIVFGNGVIGRKLPAAAEVVATYLVTNGEAANGIKSFTPSIPGYPNITISSVDSIASGGGGPETIREIKENAPKWFQAQYRVVTENDYAAFLRQNYSDIQSLSVYGGETVGQPGKVFIAIKPKSGDTLTDAAKNAIENEVLAGSNVVSIRPEVIDPFIVEIVPKTVVIYDDALASVTPEVIEARVFSLFERFNTTFIGDFLENFRVSKLSSEIQALDNSIVSTNTRISVRVGITVADGILSRYSFSVNNRLYHPNDGFNAANGGILSTNLFKREGRTNLSGFDDNGRGRMRLFDLIDGQKIYVNDQAGFINYSTGEIEITQDFRPQSDLQFTLVTESFDVLAQNSTILRIATNSAVVEVIEKDNIVAQRALNNSRSS